MLSQNATRKARRGVGLGGSLPWGDDYDGRNDGMEDATERDLARVYEKADLFLRGYPYLL